MDLTKYHLQHYTLVKLSIQLLSDKLFLIYCNKICDHSKLGGPNTKKWVGQKLVRPINWVGQTLNLIGGPVPGRPTRSAATAHYMHSYKYLGLYKY